MPYLPPMEVEEEMRVAESKRGIPNFFYVSYFSFAIAAIAIVGSFLRGIEKNWPTVAVIGGLFILLGVLSAIMGRNEKIKTR